MNNLLYKMGLSIIGCSDLEIKPIPDKYKAHITYNEPLDTKKVMESLANSGKSISDQKGLLSLIMIMSGAEHNFLDDDFKGICGQEIKVHPEAEVNDEAYDWYNNNSTNIFHVDWTTNMAYWKTSNSKSFRIDRSYSGMSDFCNTVSQFTKEKFYFPCDDILNTSICMRYCNVMKNVWLQWKHKYFPTKDLPDDLNEINEHNYKNHLNGNDDWELEFFMSLFISLKYASSCGIVRCG